MKRLFNSTITLMFLIFLMNCSDETLDISPAVEETEESDTDDENASQKNTNARIDVYDLDWENIDYMPTPPGIPRILVPWASGASRQFTLEMANDYRRGNGWELLYNTFNNEILEDRLYFILYNKYSGIIRMYFYIPPDADFIPSANIIHKIGVEGSHSSDSPILNFADRVIVDVEQRECDICPIENAKFASVMERWQVAPGTWYLFQHELAYDSQVTNQSQNTFSFIWPVRSTQISRVELNGKAQGTLTGSIRIPEIDLTISPTINNNNVSGIINVGGSSDVSFLAGLGSAFVSGAQNAIQKAASNLVEGLLDGVFGKNSGSNTDNVNLRLEAKIDLAGSIQQSFLLDSRSFAISGYDQTETVGFSPAYNKPLGVYYLSNRPTINETVYEIQRRNEDGELIVPKLQYTYEVDPSSLRFIFNPSVLAIASISRIRSEVILYEPPPRFTVFRGSRENIAGQTYYTDVLVGVDSIIGRLKGARISFDVVPKDGSPKIKIVKTFLANISTTRVFRPLPPGGGPGEEEW